MIVELEAVVYVLADSRMRKRDNSAHASTSKTLKIVR